VDILVASVGDRQTVRGTARLQQSAQFESLPVDFTQSHTRMKT
jgi:hypothetical protein